ncbi:hypothetical protein FK85_06475 [Halorubrum saccharovorum]|uniref:Archaeal Type IV pilin N-terminal domain-containing protein n=1 Tax=Halorubrum saccharovorum TaxID=2248 RepID=A0A081EUI5_9EURY|nr:type IV pilin N-terminal domain-containing protein [Halorubrum saccharovorum]KDS91073.1 hypothetical protein FK85_06475 [Halorubrum saccharovorum]
MNLKTANQGDDRAVSPVIGVILMVAITVILAAVIGTFVLGLGDQLGDSQPTAQLEISADEDNSNIVIEHTGGSELQLSEFDMQVRNGSSVEGSGTVSDLSGNSTLSVGESITIDYTAGSTGTDNIRLIHTPSDSIYADRTIVIDNFQDSDW